MSKTAWDYQTHQASSIQLEYKHINPLRFEPPIAPHAAAKLCNISLSVKAIVNESSYALNYPADVHIIEGVGGWQVPLNNTETMADFVKHCNFATVLVVGMRLGCLNHAILTYEAIKNKKIHLAGWIANFYEQPKDEHCQLMNMLHAWLKIPFLGEINFYEQPEKILQESILHNLGIT